MMGIGSLVNGKFFLFFSPVFMMYLSQNSDCSGYSLLRLNAIANPSSNTLASFTVWWAEEYSVFSKYFFIQHGFNGFLLLWVCQFTDCWMGSWNSYVCCWFSLYHHTLLWRVSDIQRRRTNLILNQKVNGMICSLYLYLI